MPPIIIELSVLRSHPQRDLLASSFDISCSILRKNELSTFFGVQSVNRSSSESFSMKTASDRERLV